MALSISCLLYAFFLGCLFSLSNSTCTDLKDCFSKVKPGKLDGYVIKTFSNKGYRDCFNECFRHATVCRALNYNKFTGLCELNSRTPDSIIMNNVTTFVNSLVPSVQSNDPCDPNPCSPSEMCVVLSSGQTSCVEECSINSTLLEAGNTMNGIQSYYKAGEHLGCSPNYTNINNSVCLANGLWTQPPLCAMKCTFDEPCLYLQNDVNALAFVNRTGSGDSKHTGCTSDHTTGNGYYYLLYAVYRNEGDIFRMITVNPFPAGQQICVGLWYHMFGSEMGSLAIQIKPQSGNFSDILVASGNQGPAWHYWSTVIESQLTDVWLAITGVRGSSYKSYICLDDVMMYMC